MTWLDRESASFGQEVWNEIDRTARAAAAELIAGRRILLVKGPLGMAERAGISEDEPVGEEETPQDEAHVHLPRIRALPILHAPLRLGARAVQAFLERGEPLDLEDVAEAARSVARAEDRLVFQGNAGAGVPGLLQHRGAVTLPLGDWADPGRAADDLLAALARLDQAGRNGPYAAAISPARYYQLLRPHPGSSLTPLAQLLPAFEGGIVKVPALLADGAVVVTKSESGPRVILGQDLAAAYDGREGIFHEISLVESVTLLEGVPGSVAVLRPGS